MPIKHAIWTIGDSPTPLTPDRLVSEQKLEEMIVADPSILSSNWMLIGRQEPTPFGGRVDLLAIMPDASLVLIELKRDRTPREVVAQALDYASWVEALTPEKNRADLPALLQGRHAGRVLQGSLRDHPGGRIAERVASDHPGSVRTGRRHRSEHPLPQPTTPKWRHTVERLKTFFKKLE
jgi:hypothetical protein